MDPSREGQNILVGGRRQRVKRHRAIPYDTDLTDEQLAVHANERRPDLRDVVIAERSTHGADEAITVRIENVSRGFTRTYELGALRFTSRYRP